MSDTPHPLDDDELMALLGDALGESDAVPSHVLDAAKAVPEIANLDAELADLAFDSDLELAGVRTDVGAVADRQLSFESDDVDIEVVIHHEERAGRFVRTLEGQVTSSGTARISLLSANPSITAAMATADELGRFRFDDIPSGAVRLMVHLGDRSRRPVVTSWFRS